jgi:RNA recognition motif-containing protein
VSNAGFQVTSSGIVRDKLTGTPWGFGFVDLEEGEDPQRAITWLNGKLLEGNTLNVFAAKPKEPDFARGQGNTRRSG